jgi:hypothetical protein
MKFQVGIVLVPNKYAPARFHCGGGELLTLCYRGDEDHVAAI